MKSSFLSGLILTGLALGLTGCENSKPKAETHEPEVPAATSGPPSPIPPVVPSPIPAMPNPGDKAPPEVKPEEKKVEPKLETPK